MWYRVPYNTLGIAAFIMFITTVSSYFSCFAPLLGISDKYLYVICLWVKSRFPPGVMKVLYSSSLGRVISRKFIDQCRPGWDCPSFFNIVIIHSLASPSRVCLKLYTLSTSLFIPWESNQSVALSKWDSGLSPTVPFKDGAWTLFLILFILILSVASW